MMLTIIDVTLICNFYFVACTSDDGGKFLDDIPNYQRSCRDKYLCTMALKYGYDSIQMPSRNELIYCNDQCATTQLYSSCPPIPLSRHEEYNITCRCSNDFSYMNCFNNNMSEYKTMMKDAIEKATATDGETAIIKTQSSTTTTTGKRSYQPYICAIENIITHDRKYPLLYVISYSNINIFHPSLKNSSIRIVNYYNSSSSSSSAAAAAAAAAALSSSTMTTSQEVIEINLVSDKKKLLHRFQTNHHQSMYSSTINSNKIYHKQLVSYSFTIETTPISIFGITPYRGQLSISYQVREIIDAIMCSRIQHGSYFHIVILLDSYKYEEFILALHAYVDLFIIDDHIIHGSYNHNRANEKDSNDIDSSDNDIDKSTSDSRSSRRSSSRSSSSKVIIGSTDVTSSSSDSGHGTILDKVSDHTIASSCNGYSYDIDSDKVIVIKKRNQTAVIKLNLISPKQYTLTSNIINCVRNGTCYHFDVST